jgi:hypothetical protein
LGGALATQLQRAEPVGDPPRVRQHKGGDEPAPRSRVGLEKPAQLADDERGPGSGGNGLP